MAPKRDALDFYVPAKGYKESAWCLQASSHATGKEVLVFLATQTLVGFALELYFKSFLSHHGIDEDDLRKNYGHDLQALFDDCIAAGLPAIPRLDEVVALTAPGHSDYTFRYFSRHISYEVMGLGTSLNVLDRLDVVVDTEIGASSAAGLEPGH